LVLHFCASVFVPNSYPKANMPSENDANQLKEAQKNKNKNLMKDICDCFCCCCKTVTGQTDESNAIMADATVDFGNMVASGAADAYEGFVGVAGSSLAVLNDTKIPLWFKAGQNENFSFYFTAIGAFIAAIGCITITAGMGLTAVFITACSTGAWALGASLAAVNCIEHFRCGLVNQGYVKVMPGERFGCTHTCSLNLTVKCVTDPPQALHWGIVGILCATEIGLCKWSPGSKDIKDAAVGAGTIAKDAAVGAGKITISGVKKTAQTKPGQAVVKNLKQLNAEMKEEGVKLTQVLGKSAKAEMTVENVKRAGAICGDVAAWMVQKCGKGIKTCGEGVAKFGDEQIDFALGAGKSQQGKKLVVQGSIQGIADTGKEKLTDEKKGEIFDVVRASGEAGKSEAETGIQNWTDLNAKYGEDLKKKLESCHKDVKEGLLELTAEGDAVLWTHPLIGHVHEYSVQERFQEVYESAKEIEEVYVLLENIQLAYEKITLGDDGSASSPEKKDPNTTNTTGKPEDWVLTNDSTTGDFSGFQR